MDDEKQRLGGLWKASPKLRRFAHQHAQAQERPEPDAWREDMAVQQAAIKFEAPVKIVTPKSLAPETQR